MKGLMPYLAVWLTATTSIVSTHREHKVHNIVLYPDKHSWCTTLPIKQVISYPGCKSEEIDNNVCVGACFSYSIPHTEPSDPGEVIVPYCDSCQPSETTWHHIMLECDKESVEGPPQLVKQVQIIANCSCSSCEKTYGHGENDGIDEMQLHHNDVPDLLSVLHIRNETNATISAEHTENVKNMMNHKIVALLQSIQEKNSQYDKVQLMELLRMIQGPEQKLSEKNIADFVDSLSSEHIELDVPKLKEILIKFEHSKLYEKHRKYGLGNTVLDSKLALTPEMQEHSLGTNENIEHLDIGHVRDGIHHSTNDMDAVDKHYMNNENFKMELNQHHHHAGENFGHGHLVKGPRGALVIEPDSSVHEKLDVSPHDLKLNHAGTMLSYGSHLSDKSTIPASD